ncbi:MAG: type IV pilin-like G/H family protein [Crocosphaera sp.]|nr:type IV pilin-like G/H family protein [Crocosphaera sp.]
MKASNYVWITGGVASLFLAAGLGGFSLKTQAQEAVEPQTTQEQLEEQLDPEKAQATALEIITKMTEAQRNYYQENGEFKVVIQEIAEELNLNLPSSFNYAVRTSFDGAYVYVLPSKTPIADQLKAYVGRVLIKSPEKAKENENQKGEIITIICQTTKTGRRRPTDPKVARAKEANSATEPSLSCGDTTVPISNSQ